MAVNCPFYGRHFVWWGTPPPLHSFNLLPTDGNQCAIVFAAHSPCKLEIDGQPVEWSLCPRVKDIRLERDR